MDLMDEGKKYSSLKADMGDDGEKHETSAQDWIFITFPVSVTY